MHNLSCSVQSITTLTPYVFKILLKPESALSFKAGQYLSLILGEKDKRAFSIANAPSQQDLIELHIGAGAEDSYAMGAVEHMRNNDSVTIEAPCGDAYLRTDSDRPTLLVAGGTGFTYVKSIADSLLESNPAQPIYLYWGVREQSALYDTEHWAEQHRLHDNFHFIPVVDNCDESWQGKSGNLLEAVLTDFESFADYDVYCAGRFDMVGKAREFFLEKGLIRERMFGDAFAFIK